VACSPRARIQAIGRDAAGRWQYVYHPSHIRHRERQKHQRLVRFGQALPHLRRAVARDVRSRGLKRDKVLATVVRILWCAFIRPGSEVYAAENGSYGIATLRRKHLQVRGDALVFDFPAKGGKRQRRELCDSALARIVRRLLRLPGYEVFKYLTEDGRLADVRRADVNVYIKQHMGSAFSAKDFRTWTATLICACRLAEAAKTVGSRAPARRRAIVAAVRATAKQLGNTPAICRASYISPRVVAAFERGQVLDMDRTITEEALANDPHRLHACERQLLRLLATNSGTINC